MARPLRALAIVVVVALVATPAMADPATVTIDAPDSVQPGETVTVTLNVTNTGANATGYLLNVSLPDGWTVADHTDDGAGWQAGDTEWVWVSIDSGDSRQPSLELTVPSDSASGSAEFTASVADSESVRDTAAVTLTVADDDGDSGGGDSGGDDSGGGDSGGSDSGGDDSGGSNSGGGDSGGSDSGGGDSGGDDSSDGSNSGGDDGSDGSNSGDGDDSDGDSSDSSGDDTADNVSIDNDSGGSDSLSGDGNNSSELDNSSLDGDSNTTEVESDEPTGSEPTETADGPASESADESTTAEVSATETDGGTGASDSENGSNTAVGTGLAVLILFGAGVGVVTYRHSVAEEPIVDGSIAEIVRGGSQTEAETTSSPDTGDGYSGADIEVREFNIAPDKCSITYATTSMGNKEIGDEIREIARGYASTDNEEIKTQRLEATVRHDGQPVATWHIDSEWMDQFKQGDLSPAALERRAVATLSFSS